MHFFFFFMDFFELVFCSPDAVYVCVYICVRMHQHTHTCVCGEINFSLIPIHTLIAKK